jgi:GT2 family glycosyltransferase
MPDLSIIIVSYNARADLDRCLQSLVNTPPRVAHEIIVVDNASTDGSADEARRVTGVQLIEAGTNLGFARANNRGIRASSGKYLLLLNSDTVSPPGAIDRLVQELESTPEAAVAGPRIVDGSGRPELSFGAMMAPLAEFRQKRLVVGQAQCRPAAVKQIEEMTRRRQWTDWVSGACLLARREAAEAVGLLDERYFMYIEDVDFCASIRARGGRVLFLPAAEVVHLRGRSRAAAPEATRQAYVRSHMTFYRKHHPWLAPLLRIYLSLRRAPRA